jgi:hypothetical protein
MKFASKFGVGEVVILNNGRDRVGSPMETLAKIVAIQFDIDGQIHFLVRLASTGTITHAFEAEMEGDPLFDQDKGCYPEEENDAD